MANIRLLRTAAAIVDGIPEDRLNLNRVYYVSDDPRLGRDEFQGPDPHHCGTVACVIGWMAMHPEMKRRGLGYVDGSLAWHGKLVTYDEAASKLFGITPHEAVSLFCSAGASKYDMDYKCTHKEVFLYRVRRFIKDQKAGL